MNRSKAKTRPARCKQVLVILNNRIQTVDLIREEIYPAAGEFTDDPVELAVFRWHGLEVRIGLDCVIFLHELPPEPQWIQDARAKVEKELASRLHSRMKEAIPAHPNEDRAAKRVPRKHRRHMAKSGR